MYNSIRAITILIGFQFKREMANTSLLNKMKLGICDEIILQDLLSKIGILSNVANWQ